MDKKRSGSRIAGGTIVDEWDVTQLIYRYANRVDVNDVEGVVACFTDDCHVAYGGGATVLHGRDELRRFLEGALGLRGGSPAPASHFMTNVLVAVDGGEANAETTAMAVRNLDPGKVTVRGLRYYDHCVRAEAGWLIRRRAHVPVWEFVTDGSMAAASPEQGRPSGAST